MQLLTTDDGRLRTQDHPNTSPWHFVPGKLKRYFLYGYCIFCLILVYSIPFDFPLPFLWWQFSLGWTAAWCHGLLTLPAVTAAGCHELLTLPAVTAVDSPDCLWCSPALISAEIRETSISKCYL